MQYPTAARWFIWLATLAALCGYAWTRLDFRHPVNTDILTLLPAGQQSPEVAAATTHSQDIYAHQLLILVSGNDVANTRDAALAAQKTLLSAGLHLQDSGAEFNRLLETYQKHHFALLDADQIRRLKDGGAAAFASDVAASLASPAGFAGAITSDPGGYLNRFITTLPASNGNFLPDGPFLTTLRAGQRYYLLRMNITGSAFSEHTSMQAASAVDKAGTAVHQVCSTCEFQATGIALFANTSRIEAQHEILWLTIVSMLLIMGIIAYVFRSLAPHILAALQLVASVAAASATVIICFGSIHILTLVAGTTLLGIAIDYAFLYFAEYWFGDAKPQTVMRNVSPGLTMGLLTGVLGFAFMLLTGFPALDQIAVFSIAGMLEAGLVVALIYPVALTGTAKVAKHAMVFWPQRFIGFACRASRWRYWLPALFLLLAVPGWLRLHASDDVQDLQHTPQQLLRVDRQIHDIIGQSQATGYFLITAPSQEQALNKETHLFGDIRKTAPGAIPLGLSRFLPAMAQQHASFAAWDAVLGKPSALYHAFLHLGLPTELAKQVESEWHASAHVPLTAESLFDAAPELKNFLVPATSNVELLATVDSSEPVEPHTLQKIAASEAGVRYIQPLHQIEDTFHLIRVRASWLVVLGYLLISIILILRYGRREAFRMLIAPLFALAVTLGALGWLNVPINIFVVVALILILGLGRDYAVFLREGGVQRATTLAVTLSALTTLCSFGLLSLSQIPALHAFGLATLIGILASYLSTPLSMPAVKMETG